MKKVFLISLITCIVLSCSACGSKKTSVSTKNNSTTVSDSSVNVENNHSTDSTNEEFQSSIEGTSSSTSNNQSTSSSTTSSKQSTSSSTTSSKQSTSSSTTSSTPTHTHSYSSATCTKAATCSCGATKGTAKGHNFGQWTVSKKATCTTNGEEVRKCANCSEKETRKIAAAHDYVGIKCSICSSYSVDILKLNTSYKEKNGLTVILKSYTVTEKSGYYSHKISYTIKNEVPNSKLMEGSFKLFFTDKTGESQYGAFNYLFYGEEVNRTYEWKVSKDKNVSVLEYNADEPDAGLDGPFFRKEPIATALHWIAK